MSKHKYTGTMFRVSTIGSNGCIVSAVLQQRTGFDLVTGRETWEDVRPLTINPDGSILLSRIDDEEPSQNLSPYGLYPDNLPAKDLSDIVKSQPRLET